MIFVVQVEHGKEALMIDRYRNILNEERVKDVFTPVRYREKKFKGQWQTVEDYCFPGYIFVETSEPRWLAKDIKGIEGYGRVLGIKDVKGLVSFVPLSEFEEKSFKLLTGNDHHIVPISEVEVEGGKIAKILSGPLLEYQDRILKVDLHHRTVQVYNQIGSEAVPFHLGIHIAKFHSSSLEDLGLYADM